RIITWENPFKSDGCTFMAAPYVVKSTSADSVDVSCAFFAADTGLFQNYLTSTGKYIEMYSDLIGKYPFKNFTVAENFFPTGYGMPAWTLLGQTVLRLPFIVATSLGHEVLHNWWGNSVYVDYSRGNWCEAATTYGADYHYKEMESPAAARDYRKDILKQYVTYVSKDKDFPIRDFKSRTSTNTRVIGYNKAMMVYHMIEQEIGTQAFFDSWKSIYRLYRGQKISWEEWIKTFEKTSGKDLSWVIPQWIDRVGAPVLALGPVKIDSNATTASKTLHIAIQDQATRPYHLRIPIRVEGTNLTIDTTILMDGAEVSVSMTVPSAAQTLAIDPDYHIFRRLYPDEIEPIVSAVLGAERRAYACTATDSASVTAFTSFCSALAEDTVKITADTSLAMLQKIGAPVLLNPKTLPEYLKAHVAQTPFQIQLDGTSFDRKGHTFVLAAQGVSDTDRSLVILTDDLQSLPRLGQLVPHYGKYSYLVFEGTKNVGKGQWPVIRSVLKVAL
ncbi:MAG TPA: M1 family aminopeptidase, partial [Candidatus Acidoferrum sp.]|nr:M1 family aminopeptidase [Candidatus Acidoferrum sp.]